MTALSVSNEAFDDPVHDAQRLFRLAMQAMAQPGRVFEVKHPPQALPPLGPTCNGLLLALADHETTIWLDPLLSAAKAVRDHLRFHTGARIVESPAAATFAVVANADLCPRLDQLAIGTLEYPDRSTTLILQVDTLEAGRGWTLSGPGIRATAELSAEPVPAGFAEMMSKNREFFPRGVDVLLAAPSRMAALPRTVRVN